MFRVLIALCLVLTTFYNAQAKDRPLKEMPFSQVKLERFYKDILEKQNIKSFDDYFTQDCIIKINNHVFNSESFKERMLWLKKNTKKINVKPTNFFTNPEGNQFTDYHISTAIDNNSVKHIVHNMVQVRLENSKIKEYVLINYFETPHKTNVDHAK